MLLPDPCSSRGPGRSIGYARSLFNTVSWVKRSSPVSSPRNLQPVSLHALFVLQNHCAAPTTASVVWARWALSLSWKRSEVIPVNRLEIPHQGTKSVEVQVFPLSSVYKALASIFLCLLKSQKNGFEVVAVLKTYVWVNTPLICLNFQGSKLKVTCIWQIFPGSWLFLNTK